MQIVEALTDHLKYCNGTVAFALAQRRSLQECHSNIILKVVWLVKYARRILLFPLHKVELVKSVVIDLEPT